MTFDEFKEETISLIDKDITESLTKIPEEDKDFQKAIAHVRRIFINDVLNILEKYHYDLILK